MVQRPTISFRTSWQCNNHTKFVNGFTNMQYHYICISRIQKNTPIFFLRNQSLPIFYTVYFKISLVFLTIQTKFIWDLWGNFTDTMFTWFRCNDFLIFLKTGPCILMQILFSGRKIIQSIRKSNFSGINCSLSSWYCSRLETRSLRLPQILTYLYIFGSERSQTLKHEWESRSLYRFPWLLNTAGLLLQEV